MTVLTKPQPNDIARHYEQAHDRLVALVRSLPEEAVATPVPATPGWDVHDVLAHLAGITTDALAGRLTGIPSDEFTGGQVRERRAASVDDVIAEWKGNLGPILEVTRTGLVPPNLAVDAITHEQDIRGAVGADRVHDAAAVRFSLEVFAFGLTRRLRAAAGPALRVEATDSDFAIDAGEGTPKATVRADEFELFRMFAGRRGRDQVLGFDWAGDPSAYLPLLNTFGELPDYDVAD